MLGNTVSPDTLTVGVYVPQAEVAVEAAVPPVGVPEQGATPVPETGMLNAVDKPPPITETLPE